VTFHQDLENVGRFSNALRDGGDALQSFHGRRVGISFCNYFTYISTFLFSLYIVGLACLDAKRDKK
jgi:hypothetical protein